jgi:hypothetical protein
MDKKSIITQIIKVHNDFLQDVAVLDETSFYLSPSGKWHAGQHLQHVLKSVEGTVFVCLTPSYHTYNKENNSCRSYEDIDIAYMDALSLGIKSPPRFVADNVEMAHLPDIELALNKSIKLWCEHLDHLTETDLDTIFLSHPALSLLSMREMMYFTVIHCIHHHNIVKSYHKA